jgi:hypothetical protein
VDDEEEREKRKIGRKKEGKKTKRKRMGEGTDTKQWLSSGTLQRVV